ncbi:MAG: hypothetical protein JWO82_818 [Akkermansiaceae bacterium]|nr:hypothetical protein [Akkermansiaceae bacterium]
MNALIGRSLLIGSCLGLLPLRAQDTPPAEVADPAPAPPTDVRVVGEIPGGTPTPPVEPKPRLVFQPDDVLTARTNPLGARVVTFQKMAPIELPLILEPQSAENFTPDSEGLRQAGEPE